MVNANITQYERENDVNHQYTKETRKKLGLDKDDGYCIECGHYNEVPYNKTKCDCDCHEEE